MTEKPTDMVWRKHPDGLDELVDEPWATCAYAIPKMPGLAIYCRRRVKPTQVFCWQHKGRGTA
jgi:hypothetical protein